MKTCELNKRDFKHVTPDEQIEIWGGCIWGVFGPILGAAAVEIFRDWDNFKAGLMGKVEIK